MGFNKYPAALTPNASTPYSRDVVRKMISHVSPRLRIRDATSMPDMTGMLVMP